MFSKINFNFKDWTLKKQINERAKSSWWLGRENEENVTQKRNCSCQPSSPRLTLLKICIIKNEQHFHTKYTKIAFLNKLKNSKNAEVTLVEKPQMKILISFKKRKMDISFISYQTRLLRIQLSFGQFTLKIGHLKIHKQPL